MQSDRLKTAVTEVAVIGAGTHGRSFAFRCVEAGHRVVLEDVLSGKLRQAEAQFRETERSAAGTLRFASGIEDAVRAADIVVDFVPDELESKLEIFCMLDRMAPPKTILCTPTTLSISDLQACTYRAEKCIALHPLKEPWQAPLELIRGQATAETTVLAITRLLESLGTTVRVLCEA